MAKHIYDEQGKYKGKILSDEEHNRRSYVRTYFLKCKICKKRYYTEWTNIFFDPDVIKLIAIEKELQKDGQTARDIATWRRMNRFNKDIYFLSYWKRPGICKNCIYGYSDIKNLIQHLEWYESNKFLLFLLIFFWPAAVYGYLKQKGKI